MSLHGGTLVHFKPSCAILHLPQHQFGLPRLPLTDGHAWTPCVQVRDQAAPSIALTDRSMAVLERSASMSSPTGMGTVTNVYNSFAGLQDMVTQVCPSMLSLKTIV